MNCRELRSLFEEDARFGLSQVTGGSDAAKHIAACNECRGFAQAWQELTAGLRTVQESAPEVSRSVDAAVLAGFRKQAAQGQQPGVSAHFWKRIRMPMVFGWSAAMAGIVVAVILLVPKSKPVSPESRVLSPEPKARDSELATVPATKPTTSRASTAAAAPRHLVTRKKKRTEPQVVNPVGTMMEASSAGVDPIPPGFRSLMFCDALSCSGAMDMIRVQLPRSIAGGTVRGGQSSDVTYADVLVGSDGIARGIRMVQ